MRHTVFVIAFKVMMLALAPLPPGTPKLPDLAGESNWGVVTQKGRDIAIGGHPCWNASGEIRPDGKVHVIWIQNADGRIGRGMYTVDGKDLTGHWGWDDQVEVSETGEIAGDICSDRISKK